MSRHAAPVEAPAPVLVHGPRSQDWDAYRGDLPPVPEAVPADPENLERSQDGNDAAGLFAAPAVVPTTGRVNPTPVVTVDGVELPGSVPDGTVPAGLVVLDDLRVVWGTDQLVGQPEPATGSLSLIDFTRTWAIDRNAIGMPVTIGWRTANNARTVFRGRVADVDLTRTSVRRPDGQSIPATRVDLKLVSKETDLANRRPAEAKWPEDTIDARAARINALCVGVGTLYHRSQDWGFAYARPADVSSTSVRDLLVQLYNSCGGDRFTYSPEKQTFEYLNRRTTGVRSLQRLFYGTAGHHREGQGVWIGPNFPRPATGYDGDQGSTVLVLDAAHLEYDDGLSRSSTNRITRVSVTNYDPPNGVTRTVTRIDPQANEAVNGERSLTLDSLHQQNNSGDVTADDLLAQVTQEGALWTPKPVRWDTRKTNGFDSIGQVHALLRGHVLGWAHSLTNSWLPQLGIRPVFAVIGGVIAYRRGAWVVDMNLAGWASFSAGFSGANSSPTRVKQHAISWEEVDDGTSPLGTLVWSDTTIPTTWHESVTYEDLGHVGLGMGTGGIGPDQGWDQ